MQFQHVKNGLFIVKPKKLYEVICIISVVRWRYKNSVGELCLLLDGDISRLWVHCVCYEVGISAGCWCIVSVVRW